MMLDVDRNAGLIPIDLPLFSLYASPVFHHQWTEIEIAVMTTMIKFKMLLPDYGEENR